MQYEKYYFMFTNDSRVLGKKAEAVECIYSLQVNSEMRVVLVLKKLCYTYDKSHTQTSMPYLRHLCYKINMEIYIQCYIKSFD